MTIQLTVSRYIAIFCMLVLSLAALVALPAPMAEAGPVVPGTYQTCGTSTGERGTVQALSGRRMNLAQTRVGSLPTVKHATTRAYTAGGQLLWTVDYRRNASSYLTTYYYNRDPDALRSGWYLVTTFYWNITGAFDKSCRAYTRVP